MSAHTWVRRSTAENKRYSLKATIKPTSDGIGPDKLLSSISRNSARRHVSKAHHEMHLNGVVKASLLTESWHFPELGRNRKTDVVLLYIQSLYYLLSKQFISLRGQAMQRMTEACLPKLMRLPRSVGRLPNSRFSPQKSSSIDGAD